jgi:hypothetical protein
MAHSAAASAGIGWLQQAPIFGFAAWPNGI